MIDYASRQRTPRKHIVGLTVVVVLHGLLFWAINSGLARKFVKVIKGPVEAVLLEETKPDIPPPPPPPPPKNLPPPPPAYVPPVEVAVAAPTPVNAIAAVSNTPQPVAPPSPMPVVAAAPVVTAAVISASSCEKPEYPSASKRLEEEGTVTLKFLVGADGKVIESAVEKSSGFRRLDEAARAGLSKCQFKPGTVDGKPQQTWASMKYTWRLE
ncbi:energy transducer TonB [Limnohabitans sp. 103DPR2]|uniref:energy transducer TonB n=1 Tax=Limnohabitans sp. 103DPR2 TaxID=1678129 RepID=UPI0006DC55C6|nr:energy transducer TonB [Limnohabitans sp. 103DPR2]ALK90498.1 Gram-negative bacterial tonB protein [Limnohabitans sp. 103DPR2]